MSERWATLTPSSSSGRRGSRSSWWVMTGSRSGRGAPPSCRMRCTRRQERRRSSAAARRGERVGRRGWAARAMSARGAGGGVLGGLGQGLDPAVEDVGHAGEQGGVQAAVAGEGFRAVEMEGGAAHVADAAAGLGDDQLAGGGVPGLEVEFPEALEAAAGGVAEIEGGGAEAAHAVGAEAEVLIEVNVGVGMALLRGEAGGEQG